MCDELATYKMIKAAVTGVIFKERKSKFIGYAYPVNSEEEIKSYLSDLWAQHPDANHICYAWTLGVKTPRYRVQDDGEPRNSAGMPIYGQIKGLDLSNTVVFVVRYFGGTKLGVGGLISAYKTAASNTLELAQIEENELSIPFRLVFDYSQMNALMRLINSLQIRVAQRSMEEKATLDIAVPVKNKKRFLEAMARLYTIRFKELSPD